MNLYLPPSYTFFKISGYDTPRRRTDKKRISYVDFLYTMLVKRNNINEAENNVKVTLLDVDDLGSVVVVKDLILNTLPRDDYLDDILKASSRVINILKTFTMKATCGHFYN